MTFRRDFLKWVYPVFRLFSTKGKNGAVLMNRNQSIPPVDVYDITAVGITGEPIQFSAFRGKYMLIVNTASDCGFTPQYADLQQLYKENKAILAVIGFPSNDFKQQEPGTNEQVADFCKIGYGVSFPLMQKTPVKQGPQQHPLYKWLTNPAQNGWNSHSPDWNFSKYLINPEGILTHYFGPAVPPAEIQKHLVKPTGQS